MSDYEYDWNPDQEAVDEFEREQGNDYLEHIVRKVIKVSLCSTCKQYKTLDNYYVCGGKRQYNCKECFNKKRVNKYVKMEKKGFLKLDKELRNKIVIACETKTLAEVYRTYCKDLISYSTLTKWRRYDPNFKVVV